MTRTKRRAETGVLLVDKPRGKTSHDAVSAVRRAFGQREVGHTGTLDPMATGLLVVMLGRATRLARFVEATTKAYVGTVVLGRATTTFDAEGEITEEVPVPPIEPERVREALRSLTGEIEQEVPAFSAVKVGGERLHAKARRGERVDAPRRRVRIDALEATRIEGSEIDLSVVCSKGTYVRTLAVQIGRALGLPAHLSMLRRTAVGGFSVDDAIPLEGLQGSAAELLPMQAAVAHLPRIEVEAPEAEDVRHGRRLPMARLRPVAGGLPPGSPLAVVGPGGDLLAVAEVEETDRKVGYACVLATQASGEADQR